MNSRGSIRFIQIAVKPSASTTYPTGGGGTRAGCTIRVKASRGEK